MKRTVAVPRPGSAPLKRFRLEKMPVYLQASLRGTISNGSLYLVLRVRGGEGKRGCYGRSLPGIVARLAGGRSECSNVEAGDVGLGPAGRSKDSGAERSMSRVALAGMRGPGGRVERVVHTLWEALRCRVRDAMAWDGERELENGQRGGTARARYVPLRKCHRNKVEEHFRRSRVARTEVRAWQQRR